MLKNLAINVVLVLFLLNQAAFSTEFRFSPRPNKAHLVQWRQWGNEALAEAKKDDKLILLSLSAVWCHWCHVMDETTYSDIDIIDYINKNFVPIRVDADMRPDVDSLYNQGGWPTTVILTPEGEIVQGGTYIPQENMTAWLSTFAEMFAKDRKAIKERIAENKERTKRNQQAERAAPGNADIIKITGIIESSYDRKYGGFGASQKFPNPDSIDFLLLVYERGKDPDVKAMISATLENMSRGEIYDGVEGGFFRYATRPDWSAPHYEKMLELNAALVRNYALASMVFGNGDYKKVVRETIGYIKKYLYAAEEGAFFGSQDADETYYKSTKRLGAKPPHVDRTIYADSNAQLITALIAAYGAAGEKEYLEMARKTAEFMLKKLYSNDAGVYHYYSGGKRLKGLLSDNALFGLALIDLYNATGEKRYLTAAEHIAHLLASKFYVKEKKQFRPSLDTTAVRPSTAGALWEYNTFLANYRAALFLGRLYYYDRSKDIREIVDETNATFKNSYGEYEPSAALYGTALLWSLEEPLVCTIIADDTKARSFLRELNRMFIPRKVVNLLSLKRERDRIRRLGFPPEEALYVCSGKRCSPAFTKPEELSAGIKRFINNLGPKNK